jgi:uncharacterized protein (TIGR00725 family)
MQKIIIGVMGAGEQATELDQKLAYELGQQIAAAGWVLLTGGRPVGVMGAASRGAKQANGLTVGILPTANQSDAVDAVDIVIATGLGNARNAINVLSSHVVIACGMGSGTASEVALAIKSGKPVILLNVSCTAQAFFRELSAAVLVAESVEAVMQQIRHILARQGDCANL